MDMKKLFDWNDPYWNEDRDELDEADRADELRDEKYDL